MGKPRDSANLVSDTNIFSDITNERVGIGTTQPTKKLDVEGDINFTGSLYQDGELFVASRWSVGSGTSIYRMSNVGIGTTNPSQELHVVGVITATSYRGDGSQLTGISVGNDITSCLFT